MSRVVTIGNQRIVLSEPTPVPSLPKFVGRKRELQLCRAAWGVSGDGTRLLDGVSPLHFRLEGSPGCGKNEIVYEIARRLGLPLYTIQGHEEVTPEDLSLLLVPEIGSADSRNAPLTLRASPLATALLLGGLFFFDEINRVPERALSPLASVLDSRTSIYSAMAGLHLSALSKDAAAGFRFCCALNPQLSDAGRGVLPEYIEERTLPAIAVDHLPYSDLHDILRENLPLPGGDMDDWESWYKRESERRLSVRQALTIVRYASSLKLARGAMTMHEALVEVEPMVLRPEDRAGKNEASAKSESDADDDDESIDGESPNVDDAED